MYSYFSGFIATPSKIREFLECPRKYWYFYINPATKHKQPEKSYFTLGHDVHSALDTFFKIPVEIRKKDMLLKEFNKIWESHTGKYVGFKTKDEEAEFKVRGDNMLKRFLEYEDWHISPLEIPGDDSFIPGYRTVGVDKGLAFGGVIDRLDKEADGFLHVVDYKTGKSDVPDDWQLPMYAVLAGRLLNSFVGKTSYIFLDHGKRVTKENSIEDNLDIIKRVTAVVEKIPKTKNKEDFVCKDGESCRHCNYLSELGYDIKTDKWTDAIENVDDEKTSDLPF